MRIFDYDRFVLEKRARFFPLKAKLGYRRMARNKIRSIEERDALMEMDKKRFERKAKSGEIELLNARFYKVRL